MSPSELQILISMSKPEPKWSATENSTNDAREGRFEFLVCHHVDYWVEGRVKIS